MWDTDNAGSNAPATANTTWPGPATGNWDDHAEYNYGYSSDCPGASVPSVIQYRFPECEVVMNVAIHWMRGERAVAWTYGDQRIVKEFDEPLRTVTYLDGPPA